MSEVKALEMVKAWFKISKLASELSRQIAGPHIFHQAAFR
jgi:hypothetical protein